MRAKLPIQTDAASVKLEEAIKTKNFQSEHHKATLNLLYTASWVRNRVSRRLKLFGLTHEQYNVLRILRGSNPRALPMMSIATRMLDPSSNVTRIVDKLRSKELAAVCISAADRREREVGITPDGLALLAQIDKSLAEEPPVPEFIDETDCRKLNDLIERFRGVCPPHSETEAVAKAGTHKHVA